MKQVAIWHIYVVMLLAITSSIANATTLSGSISGTVKDKLGNPLVEASVSVRDTVDKEKVLKTTKTDKEGKFVASNLSPGNYTLMAQAIGYKSELIANANVTPHKTAVFEFKLRRVSELLTPEQNAESYKYVMGRNRSIFQWEEQPKPVVIAEKRPFIRETHGLIQFHAAQAISDQPGAANFAGLNFALAQMVNENLEVVVAGQTGIGALSQQRLETTASLLAGDDHQFSLSIGYGQLPGFAPNAINKTAVNQYSVRATDRWHIAGPVVIVYGFDYSRLDGAIRKSQFAPRVNLDLQVADRDQLFAAIYSPSGADIESSADFETTQVNFHGPVELINFDPSNGQSRRLEIGYVHTFKDRSRFETALFWDNIAGRNVGLFTLPVDNEQLDGENLTSKIEQRGRTRGVRVIFTRNLTNNVSASVGYALGKGQQLTTTDGQPDLSMGYFQVVTGKIDAQIVRTGTRVSATLRLASPRALLAIDPFQERLQALDPNISIYLTQSVPMFAFIPGRWEAMVDARNLLDNSNGENRTQLMLGQYWRTVRGGFSVRF